jgi:hypothetical protein
MNHEDYPVFDQLSDEDFVQVQDYFCGKQPNYSRPIFGINQEMEMIVIPNSPFTVLFLDSRFHKIEVNESIRINDPVSHIDVQIYG